MGQDGVPRWAGSRRKKIENAREVIGDVIPKQRHKDTFNLRRFDTKQASKTTQPHHSSLFIVNLLNYCTGSEIRSKSQLSTHQHINTLTSNHGNQR
jgi:hypothetical protein